MRLGLSQGLSTGSFVPSAAAWSNTYSCDFDGSDDYVNCATGSDINFMHTAATLGYWAKHDSSGDSIRGIGIDESGKDFFMGIYAPYNATWALIGDGSSYATITSVTGLTGWDKEDWNHYAVTISGNDLKTYVNGIQVSATTWTANSSKNPTVNFFIGGANNGSGGLTNRINGKVDEVAIWNVALDAAALLKVYNSGDPIDLTEDDGDYDNSSNLFSYWRMGDDDGGSGSTITDQGSGSNDGTISGGVSFSSDLPSS